MIVVISVKTQIIEGPGDVVEIMKYQSPEILRKNYNDLEEIKYTTETIKGRYFINHRDEEVCIGWAKEVHDALDIPLDIYEYLSKENNRLYVEIMRKDFKIKKYNEATFWKRLKYLFGDKI